MNNTLIPVFESTINEELVQTVNARELHAFLESKQDFSTWIKARIDHYGFVENQDFTRFHRKMEANNATIIEYHISIDMAKEVSMVERNDKGKEARRYFIACEKKLNYISSLSPAELLVRQSQMLLSVEKEQRRQAEEMKLLTDRQRITEVKIEDFANGAEHFSITAYNKLFRKNQISHSEANKDGRQLSKIARDSGIKLGTAPHPTFGTVHTYPKAMMDSFYRGEYN
jgi:phage anti-repressor protein